MTEDRAPRARPQRSDRPAPELQPVDPVIDAARRAADRRYRDYLIAMKLLTEGRDLGPWFDRPTLRLHDS